MALGFFQALTTDRAIGWSGGSEPGREVNPSSIAAMAERGVDISAEFPKPWTDETVRAADVVVSMGLRRRLPHLPRQTLRILGRPRRPRGTCRGGGGRRGSPPPRGPSSSASAGGKSVHPQMAGHRWSTEARATLRTPPALHGIAGRLGVHRHPGRLEVVTVAMPDGHFSKVPRRLRLFNLGVGSPTPGLSRGQSGPLKAASAPRRYRRP